jgi:hypothetical protein
MQNDSLSTDPDEQFLALRSQARMQLDCVRFTVDRALSKGAHDGRLTVTINLLKDDAVLLVAFLDKELG